MALRASDAASRRASVGLRVLRRSPLMTAGLVMVGLVVLCALLAPFVGTRDPIQQNLALANRPPAWQARGTAQAPLGTDQFGRDVWSRIVYGAQISLAIGTVASLLGAVVGVTAGLVAGFYGGKVDIIVMRIVDLNLAFPLILLALAIAAILGPSLQNLVMVMALTTWMIYARVVRGRDALAARARVHPGGAGDRRGRRSDHGAAHPAEPAGPGDGDLDAGACPRDPDGVGAELPGRRACRRRRRPGAGCWPRAATC